MQTVRRRRRRGPRAMTAVSVCLLRAIWWLRGTYNAVTTSRPHSSASAAHCTDGTFNVGVARARSCVAAPPNHR